MTIPEADVAVYRQHADALIRYATVLVGPDDAPDVVTDAVLKAFATPKWSNVEHRKAYLFRSVLNQASTFNTSHSRRRRRERVVALRAPARSVDPEPSVDAQRALQTLSPKQRAVIYLAYWEDQTAADIADLLDISEGSVRKHLARGRDNLRKTMAP